MTRDEILQAIKDAHENFLETIADIPDDIATTQRVIDWWTLKDVLGHISTWYLVARQFIREYARGDVPTPLGFGQSDAEVDAYNKRAAATRRDYSLARVRAELDAACRDLLAAIESLSDADITKQLPAPWGDGNNLEQLVAVNSYEHLPEHIAHIRAWQTAQRMTARQLLNLVRAARAEWDATLAQIGVARMSEPGVEGAWSVKDIIAHITFFEREMIGMIRQHALRGSDLWHLSQTARNDAIFQQNRERALNDVLSEAREIFSQLVAALETLRDDELNDASHFAEMPGDWKPWDVIAGNTYRHYRAHIPAMRAWAEAH